MSEEIVEACFKDLTSANLRCQQEFIRRYLAALLTKRFVIFTGLAGSGKTKIAQAFARWISPTCAASDPFTPGSAIPASRISYGVLDADRLAVELWNDPDPQRATKVVLPRALIQEWVDYITKNHIDEGTPARTIREAVSATTKYSTQLNSFETHLKAAAFAMIAAPSTTQGVRCYEVISVGADWTSNEHVLGYPDGLDKSRYVRTKALDLILRAAAEPGRPYFLILDEMNLSHVERYFSDLLSAIESDEPIHLHADKNKDGSPGLRDGVPGEVCLPPNLYIIGTVNVDETTYMFSPKVLDRANVLEFRVSGSELKLFLENPAPVDIPKLDGAGCKFVGQFMGLARTRSRLMEADRKRLESEMMLFFSTLQAANSEFGFRVAKEVATFVGFHKELSSSSWDFRLAMDAQIFQKLLPKLHGSRNFLEPILCAIALLCFEKRTWEEADGQDGYTDSRALQLRVQSAMRMEDDGLDPLSVKSEGQPAYAVAEAYYPMSFEKVIRMLERLRANGFTSFAEA